jgi:hypothetical protein
MPNNFFPENCAIYEIMWKNIVELDKPCVAMLNDYVYKHTLRMYNR